MASSLTSIPAHGPGATKLKFSVNGKKIYTGGDDCIVRVWDAHAGSDQEPKAMAEANESITAIDTSRKGWVAGGDDAIVRSYSEDTDEMVASVVQTGGVPIRCLAYSPKGDRLVVGSDDLEVKLVDTADTLQCQHLKGHTRGLRAASWHPSGSHLTTSGQDGKIIVWDCVRSPPEIIYEIDGLITACSDALNDEFCHTCTAVWHPSGDHFVVATRSHEIVTVSRKDWQKSKSFSKSGHASDIAALAYSANGLYLASAGRDNQVIVWDSQSRIPIARIPVESGVITDIAWSPSSNLLAWTDRDGAIVRWIDPVPSHHPSPATNDNRDKRPQKKDAHSKIKDLFDEGDDTAMDDVEAPGFDRDPDDDDWVENDVGDEYAKEKDFFKDGAREMVNVTKAQPAFQPGSTPFKGKKRYLAFNSIGVIEASDQDLHQLINVDFHDKALRKGYFFQDTDRCSMAALGERGVAFASVGRAEQLAAVLYRPYETWGGSSDWRVSLSPGEDPVAVATGGMPLSKYMDSSEEGGNGNVAVATSKGYIRFFSGSGLQLYVWTVGGDVIAMVSGAEWLFAVHREGGTSLDGCQNLRYSLMSLDAFDILQSGHLPLPRGTTLSWLGITGEGAPAIYDSAGTFSVLDRFRRPTQGRWVPLLDTTLLERRIGKEEYYWPVSLSSSQLLCVILKGFDRNPGFPRPMLHDIDVRMPLLDLEEPHVQLEEKLLRESMYLTMQKDASADPDEGFPKAEIALDKYIIQLIQLSCKADKLQRAADLTRRLNHIASYDSAQKVAGFYQMIGLQERMAAMQKARDGEDHDGDIDPRKGWGKVTQPIPKSFADESSARPSHTDFDRFAPPPTVPRRTLARAVPVGEVAFARPQPATGYTPLEPLPPMPTYEDSSMEVDPDSSFASDWEARPDAGSKRKRMDDSIAGSAATTQPFSRGPSTALAEATGVVPFAPQPKMSSAKSNGNPFARKPANGGNPFAKGRVAETRTLGKSNSFFEKVDAAEAEGPSARASKTKEATKTKQTKLNLFTGKPDKKSNTTAKPASHKAVKPGEETQDSPNELTGVMSTASHLFDDSQLADETQPDYDEQSPPNEAQVASPEKMREVSPDWEIEEDDDASNPPVSAAT